MDNWQLSVEAEPRPFRTKRPPRRIPLPPTYGPDEARRAAVAYFAEARRGGNVARTIGIINPDGLLEDVWDGDDWSSDLVATEEA